MRFWLLTWFVTWSLAFCGRQLKYFHGPYLRSVSLLYVIVSLFSLLAITEAFHFAGALRLDNRKVFRFPGCKVSLVFCFKNKYGSRPLKSLFLSTSPIASSRVCWGVYNCLEYDENSQVSLFYMCASHVLWALWLKSIKLSNCKNAATAWRCIAVTEPHFEVDFCCCWCFIICCWRCFIIKYNF